MESFAKILKIVGTHPSPTSFGSLGRVAIFLLEKRGINLIGGFVSFSKYLVSM